MRTNLVRDPKFGSGTTASFTASGTGITGTLANVATGPNAAQGSPAGITWKSLRYAVTTPATASPFSLRMPTGTSSVSGITPLTSYAVSAWLRTSHAITSARVEVTWYTSTGTAIGSAVSVGSTALTVTNAFQRISGVLVSPAGAAFASIAAVFSGPETVPAGGFFYVTGLLLETGTEVLGYFDGDLAGASWSGAANASTSLLPNTVPTLTPSTDGNPSIAVMFSELLIQTRSLTLFRQYGAGIVEPVRGAENVTAAGAFTVTDAEAPIGIPIVYRAQQFGVDGSSLGYSDTATATVYGAPGMSYLSDPRRPAAWVAVEMTENAGAQPSNPIPATFHTVGGNRRVALVGQRAGLTGLRMDFYTSTTADRDAVDDLIGQASGLVLIRTPPPMPVPRVLYCFAGNATPDEFPPPSTDVEWLLTVEQLPRYAGGFTVSPVTWQDYVDAFPTWSALQAAYLRWVDLQANPPTTGG